jgi:hypothetical protein
MNCGCGKMGDNFNMGALPAGIPLKSNGGDRRGIVEQFNGTGLAPQGFVPRPINNKVVTSGYLAPVGGLGETEDEMALRIVKEYYVAHPGNVITIGTEAFSGKFDTLTGDVKNIAREICKGGVVNEAQDFFTKNWTWLAGGSVGLLGIYLLLNKKKGK